MPGTTWLRGGRLREAVGHDLVEGDNLGLAAAGDLCQVVPDDLRQAAANGLRQAAVDSLWHAASARPQSVASSIQPLPGCRRCLQSLLGCEHDRPNTGGILEEEMMEEAAVALDLETTAPMEENYQTVEAATARTAEIDLETTLPMEENHQTVEAATAGTAEIELETTLPMEENHQTVEAATAGTAEIDLETTAPMEDSHQTVETATSGKAEIDTSAPFLSVREAVDRFGGIAVWKSQLRELFHPEKLNYPEDVNEVISMEEQAAQLEMDLILKEKETLNVLQELEMTKKIVDALKLRLQKEVPEAIKMPVGNFDNMMIQSVPETEEHCPSDLEEDGGANQSKENLSMITSDFEKDVGIDDSSIGVNQSSRRIPVELKQVKENITKTASDLADIRTSIGVLNMKIQEEKLLLDKSQEKLTANATLISSLEEDLNQTATELERAEDLESENCEDSSNILQEIKELNSEVEQSKKTNEASKAEASELASEIEHTKASIKTVELRGLAARKMEEAAKAAEAMALADIKALICSNKAIFDLQNTCGVTLSMEEYMALASKAQEADLYSRKKLETVMLEVDQVNMSKSQLLTKVEEAMTEAKKCKKALEDALKRAEVANRAKLEIEDALRRCRSEHGHQSHNAYNSTKFRKDSLMLDLKSSSSSGQLSIGQILSMKLADPESLEQHEIGGSWEKENEKPTVSLGQMLNKRHGACLMSQRLEENRHLSIKRTKLGFVGLPHLLGKQGKNTRKRHSSSIE
ncbi:hypothetical protein ZIOFF_018528 [Zingiber officinale]|uniref:WEB family protein n=2 Tax=Zingiber officinale TaxID=94328 RepID=A0A8J5HCZ8_ZINOF|nr:hypothetical protein ZIOFF_018528 [Zingiber officinale]